MKFMLITLTMLLSSLSFAQALSKIDLKPPYDLARCHEVGVDVVSELGFRVLNMEVLQEAESIRVSTVNNLSICRFSEVEGVRYLNWEVVNAYKGFDVQYFNHATNLIDTYRTFIDPKNKINRFEMVLFKPDYKVLSRSTLNERSNDRFGGSVEFATNKLFSTDDIKKLNSGKAVIVRLELYYQSNFTQIIKGEKYLTGDENRSGQNLFLSFVKKENRVLLKSARIN